MFGDNQSVITSSALPHSRLSECWNALSCHHVREAVAGSWFCFEHILGAENPVDVLTEPLPWHALKNVVEPLLVWKREAVDASPGKPNPEGSDKDPGHGMSWVANQSCVVMANCGHDLTGGMQMGASHENRLAGVLIALCCLAISAVSCSKKVIGVDRL